MITLNLPPKMEQAVHHQATKMGVSVERYLLDCIQSFVQSDVVQFVQGKQLDSFDGDPVAWQRAMRDE
mgnify:FL=1